MGTCKRHLDEEVDAQIAATINEARTSVGESVGAGAVLQPKPVPALIESAQDEAPAAKARP